MAKPVRNVHWIKWHTKETIYGSYMTERVDSLGFLVKMCCLSAETRYPGYIQSEYQRGIPYHTLAPLLNIPLELFEELMKLNQEAGRLVEDGNGVIEILNWEKFQTIEKWDGNPATKPKPVEPEKSGTPKELLPQSLLKQAELDSKLPKRELIKLSAQRQEAARAYREDPDKYIKGKYGHMVKR